MQKILVIQTAFIGDVVLATALAEKLHLYFAEARIDFLVRQGNETLLANNPHIHTVLVWNKKEDKTKNLFRLIQTIRKTKYDRVINLQRFFSTGLMTALSGAQETVGFDKNPLSFLYSKKVPHVIGRTLPSLHELERNQLLIEHITDQKFIKPRLYPSDADVERISPYTQQPYITVTPSSVWFTKQYPFEKWVEFMNEVPSDYAVYILGGKENVVESKRLQAQTTHPHTFVLAGEFSFLQSAALMKNASMNYVNDSAPLHFASAMNAPVTAIFCSTLPAFGFTPVSDTSYLIETLEPLTCRPCGLHGKKTCVHEHFKCGYGIKKEQLLKTIGH
jgi:ADP-heptose:LPS heptosyltransferase